VETCIWCEEEFVSRQLLIEHLTAWHQYTLLHILYQALAEEVVAAWSDGGTDLGESIRRTLENALDT
jgi:hypothetical protein